MSDIAAFVEDLIQLQIKHKILLEGYDMDYWTEEHGVASAAQFNNPEYLVTEEKIRLRWEDDKTRKPFGADTDS